MRIPQALGTGRCGHTGGNRASRVAIQRAVRLSLLSQGQSQLCPAAPGSPPGRKRPGTVLVHSLGSCVNPPRGGRRRKGAGDQVAPHPVLSQGKLPGFNGVPRGGGFSVSAYGTGRPSRLLERVGGLSSALTRGWGGVFIALSGGGWFSTVRGWGGYPRFSMGTVWCLSASDNAARHGLSGPGASWPAPTSTPLSDDGGRQGCNAGGRA